MSINLGATAISSLKLGVSTPSKVMLGAQQVWPLALWTPADLPGLYSWHEAWDPLTVVVDGNQRVTQWNDKSGSGRHYTQAQSTFQGTYDSARKVIVRNTDGGMMVMLNDTVNQPTAITLASIMSVTLGSVDNVFFTKGDQPYNAPGFYQSNGNFQHWNGSTHVELIATLTRPLLSVFRHSASGGTGFANGVSESTIAVAFSPRSTTVPRGLWRWDRNNPFVADFNGDCYCIIESTQEVSDADRQRLEGYMAHGAGLQSLLPANHPYKTAPPTK